MMTRWGLVAPCASLVLAACGTPEFEGAQAEVKPHNIQLDLPAVPKFDLPPPNPDGSHSVKEMRVKSKKFLDSEVSVKGYITWVYDCATALRTPEMSDAEVQKIIEEDPTKCRKPVFYLGDTPDTSGERSVWIVEVPRNPTKLEKERLPKEELKAWPPVPPYARGDEVIVTGDWKQASPYGEKNTAGLLVYKRMKNVTQNWETPADAAVPGAMPGGPAPAGGGRPPIPGMEGAPAAPPAK